MSKTYIGQRVKLNHPYGVTVWCAGTVPNGATGTIIEFVWNKVTEQKMLGIDFDDYKPKGDSFHFGIGELVGEPLPNYLEEISTK